MVRELESKGESMSTRGVIFRVTSVFVLIALTGGVLHAESNRADSDSRMDIARTPASQVGRIIEVETLAVSGDSSSFGNFDPSSPETFDLVATDTVHPSEHGSPVSSEGSKFRLPPRRSDNSEHDGERAASGRSPTWTIVSSLTIVVGIFLVMVWGTRRHLPQSATPLPDEVVRVLGRAPLAHRQTMQLVRIGNKLVLLCVTPQGAETLAEITDLADVERLTANCDPSCPDSMSAAFRQVLAQVGDHRGSNPYAHGASMVENSYSGRIRD